MCVHYIGETSTSVVVQQSVADDLNWITYKWYYSVNYFN